METGLVHTDWAGTVDEDNEIIYCCRGTDSFLPLSSLSSSMVIVSSQVVGFKEIWMDIVVIYYVALHQPVQAVIGPGSNLVVRNIASPSLN